MHICFKILKFLLHSTLLYMFRTLLCQPSGPGTVLRPNQSPPLVGPQNRTGNLKSKKNLLLLLVNQPQFLGCPIPRLFTVPSEIVPVVFLVI
jgi:hypothetical protein